ncbi:ribosome assembly factor SBDS [Candidatus Pacearchaeota archaeon]|nr:ribosome assembly factor SBDS [Candidatus Pacearchaeota archaeon]|tara:strand:- start:369 stop:1049 length:681 start_codon:yes stop_codon:yes gene_type:complete
MPNVEARVRVKEKQYEILVDLDEALKVKDGSGDITAALQSNAIFYDLHKGLQASESDLKAAFGTSDLYEASKQIIQKGEVQKTQEFRSAEQEKRIKQVVDLIITNAVDQNGNPYTEDRIKRAISEVSYSFTNAPPEQQMPKLIEKLKTVIPISLELKRIKLTIPAQYTGQAYGLINEYKEDEEWLPNGDLQVIINIPAGMQIDFYDKLNNITHGAVQSEELQAEPE